MDKNRWFIFSGLVILIFGVLVLNKKSDDIDVSKIDASRVVTSQAIDTIKKNDDIDIGSTPDHVFGAASQKVVLIEYGDFQCPGCGSLYPSLKPLKEHYKDQLTFIFRNLPLTTIHPNALAAATAAEAAGKQDKFWQYHDVLYEKQNEWSSTDSEKRGAQFETYAESIGLNIAQFKKDLGDAQVVKKIARDQALGRKIGASATPTLILNGKTIEQDSWKTPKDLENIIREALKKSGTTLPEPLNKDE
jgi:protein-disulfide isomerase